MTDKIREAFEKQHLRSANNLKVSYAYFRDGFLAGRQSLLDELEQVEVKQLPYESDGRTTRYKQIPVYCLPEGVTK